MKFSTLVRFSAMLCSVFTALSVNAISINTMFQLADENGGATYTITNNTEDRIFLNVVMYEFYTEDGELKKTAYTRNNINDWEISVRPARAVINPGFEKDFRITMNCKSECDNAADQAFQIGFVPTPYFAEGEQPPQSMQIAVGFGANFVNTGKEQQLDFTLDRDGDKVSILNNSRAMITATLSTCSVNATREELKLCEQTARVISQRNYQVTLKEQMRGKVVTITVDSVDGNFQQVLKLKP